MKVVVALAVIAGLCVGGYFYFCGQAKSDQTKMMGWGFTKPFESKAEIHVEINKVMIEAEPPAGWPDAATGWPEWVKAHFEVRDSSGGLVPVAHAASSVIATDRKGPSVEGYMSATVKVGETYTVSYTPVTSQAKGYSLKCTVPSDEQYVKREYWQAK